MSKTIAERFIEGLGALEASGNTDGLVALFTQDAEVGNVVAPEKFHGPEGARDFWTKYRDTFEKVHSTFRNRIIDESRIALEWNTVGTAVHGAPVEYSGVSILWKCTVTRSAVSALTSIRLRWDGKFEA